MSRESGRGGVVGGLILIVLGLIFLAGQSGIIPWSLLWPLFVVTVGAMFLLGLAIGGRNASGLAIPGCIITTIGLILLYQNTFNRWETWAYAWTLIPAAVGVGLLIHGRLSGEESARRVGTFLAGLGLVLFLVFGGLAEVLFGLFGWRDRGLLWPLVLIGLGLYLLLYRAFSPGVRGGAELEVVENGAGIAPRAGGSVRVPIEAGGFVRLAHRGIGEVHLRQGDHDGVEIEAPAHVRSRLITRVIDGTLEIGHRHDWWDWADWFSRPSFRPIRFHVTMREIEGIGLSGAGQLLASGINADRLDITLSGAGNIRLDAVTANALIVRLQSVGSIEIRGRAETEQVELSGAGSYRGGDLETRQAVVRLRGLGSATVWAREELTAELSGLGKIEYYGSPRVTQRINGLGHLESLGGR